MRLRMCGKGLDRTVCVWSRRAREEEWLLDRSRAIQPDRPTYTYPHTPISSVGSDLAVEEALGRLAAPLLALVDQVVRAVEAVCVGCVCVCVEVRGSRSISDRFSM